MRPVLKRGKTPVPGRKAGRNKNLPAPAGLTKVLLNLPDEHVKLAGKMNSNRNYLKKAMNDPVEESWCTYPISREYGEVRFIDNHCCVLSRFTSHIVRFLANSKFHPPEV